MIKMKKKYLVYLAFLGLAGLIISCGSVSVEQPETLMWEVQSGTNSVYLLGSIHFASEDFYPLNPKIESAFDNSSNLAVEFDINKADPMKMMKFAFFQDGTILKDKLDSATYSELKDKLEKLGIPEMMISRMKPWFAAMTAQITELTNQGFSAEMGIDKYFLAKAFEQNKTIFELESMEEQLQIFEQIEEFSNDFIKLSLKSIEDTVSNQNLIIEAYKKADIVAMEKLLNEGMEDEAVKKINFIMNDKRNFKMLPKIEDYLKDDKNYFVVVGAAHLIGENGLINLLTKQNKYKIIRR